MDSSWAGISWRNVDPVRSTTTTQAAAKRKLLSLRHEPVLQGAGAGVGKVRVVLGADGGGTTTQARGERIGGGAYLKERGGEGTWVINNLSRHWWVWDKSMDN